MVHNSDYKGNRAAPPDELIPQFDLAKEVVEAFSIPNIGIPGFEADDCLGTIATRSKDKADVVIVTGDHDILQVLDDHITVVLLKKRIR
ncbi:PIN domain-containing protein [Caldibacillus thermoamylovorans]|uniref:PIN domain-containing protein n=1 Tax=Caldibacillus thermoamylovorans TaxID=35841 RepID=UPI001FD19FDE|nr:PIN domain-containing protein [Caldibacillus thermoamylovorans]